MKLSVIIPTLNEEQTICALLDSLYRQSFHGHVETIVVDGESTDKTVERASAYAHVVQSKPGRARQMNAGVREATGDILLFLHSDSILEAGALLELSEHMHSTGDVGGCFRLAFSEPTWPLRLVAWGSDLRARWWGVMFGDQGIFVQRDVFRQVGGFPEIPLMEDWELSRKLKTEGKTCVLQSRIYTSPRRFEQYGVWKTLLHMQRLKWLYITGTSPSDLKRVYLDTRKR